MLSANERRTVAKGTWIRYRLLELEPKWIRMILYIYIINYIYLLVLQQLQAGKERGESGNQRIKRQETVILKEQVLNET